MSTSPDSASLSPSSPDSPFHIYSSSTDEEAVIVHHDVISTTHESTTALPNTATTSTSTIIHSPATRHTLTPSQNFLIGAIAGSSQQLLSYPLEYIKTMKQFHNVPYRDIFRGIWRKPSSAWRGSLVTCICYSPRSAVRFAAYEYFFTNLQIHNAFVAGALSGIVEAVTVATISETIKTKYMVSKEGILDSLRREGFFAIYKGAMPMIGKQILNHSVRFGGTEHFISWMTGGDASKRQLYHVTLGAGLSGLLSVLVTQPLDTLKSLQQSGDPRYKTLGQCMKALNEGEGGLMKQFYRGSGARVARVILEVSLTFSIYDFIKHSLINYLYDGEGATLGKNTPKEAL